MSKMIRIGKKKVTFYGCKDCLVGIKTKPRGTLRPNGKFCCPDCMNYVLKLSGPDGVTVAPEPDDEIKALKNRVSELEKEIRNIHRYIAELK